MKNQDVEEEKIEDSTDEQNNEKSPTAFLTVDILLAEAEEQIWPEQK